ncbi:MAG: hypothetical protein ACKOE6_01510 [Flammeovirgaceae bacterium]
MELTKWKIGFFVVLVGVLIWLSNLLNKVPERMYDEFINKEYHGVIQDIRFVQSHRGYPDILLQDKWILLTPTEQILFDQIKIGDSIVKYSGSNKIMIYESDSSSKWKVTEFQINKDNN